MNIELGSYRQKIVSSHDNDRINKHMLFLGASGAGKSVEEQKVAVEIVAEGGTVVMLDFHRVFAEDEIFWKYKTKFSTHINEINVYEEGVSCNLFEPLDYSDGTKERLIDTINAVIDVFDRTLKLGYGQRSSLRKAIDYVIEEGTYNEGGFYALEHALARIDTPAAEAVREKLYPLIAHNIFRHGDFFIKEGKINVVRLSKFDSGTQEAVAELLMAYIWRLGLAKKFKENEIFLFVDEFQNLPSGRRSALAQILSEGRKFGINLILATQQMPRAGTSSIVFQRMLQCGLILYFRPSVDQIRMIAKMIDPENINEWVHVLRDLRKGEFVASGALELSGHRIEHPLLVTAYEEPCTHIERTLKTHVYTPERGKTNVNRRLEGTT